MHEVSLMEQTLALAVQAARDAGASRIHQIRLRIGRLAGVEPEALGLAFQIVTEGTIAEGAGLEVESVPIHCYCSDCGQGFDPSDMVFACPTCGRCSSDIRTGQELELASLEIS